ncbi:MAG: T9SS type A sorting domain-containing protein [Ignavibacteria bacterium]
METTADDSSFNLVILKSLAYFFPGDIISSVSNNEIIPVQFNLSQNYPNPFNPMTTIDFSIAVSSNSNVDNLSLVTLKVYDLLGREVAVLVNEKKSAGNYKVQFDGTNLSSGIYFYRLTVEGASGNKDQGFIDTKKLVLLK